MALSSKAARRKAISLDRKATMYAEKAVHASTNKQAYKWQQKAMTLREQANAMWAEYHYLDSGGK